MKPTVEQCVELEKELGYGNIDCFVLNSDELATIINAALDQFGPQAEAQAVPFEILEALGVVPTPAETIMQRVHEAISHLLARSERLNGIEFSAAPVAESLTAAQGSAEPVGEVSIANEADRYFKCKPFARPMPTLGTLLYAAPQSDRVAELEAERDRLFMTLEQIAKVPADTVTTAYDMRRLAQAALAEHEARRAGS